MPRPIDELRLVVLPSNDVEPFVVSDAGDVICPCCGNDDIALWANDGEADLADWWHCQAWNGGCESQGAVVLASAPLVTQNGLPMKAFAA